jgi:hypothetical protein
LSSTGLAALLVGWYALSGTPAARGADAVAALRAAGGLAISMPADVTEADTDGDGEITIVDAVAHLRAASVRRGGRVTRTAENRYGSGGVFYGVVLDDSLLNGNPEARLVVTHRFVGAFNGTLGVWYYAALGRWVIFNEDKSPMRDGEVFHYAFADITGVAAGEGDFRVFLDGLDADALPLATHCYTGVYNAAPIGVGYDNPPRWYAYNESYAPFAAGEVVFATDARDHGGVVFHAAGNDYHGYGVYIDDLRLNNNPDAVLLAGHSFVSSANPSPIGVWYDETQSRWLAYCETTAPMRLGEAVHYLIASP